MSDRLVPYQHKKSHAPASTGAGPVCEHDPECSVRELWPAEGETHEQFVARLTAKYSGLLTTRQNRESTGIGIPFFPLEAQAHD